MKIKKDHQYSQAPEKVAKPGIQSLPFLFIALVWKGVTSHLD